MPSSGHCLGVRRCSFSSETSRQGVASGQGESCGLGSLATSGYLMGLRVSGDFPCSYLQMRNKKRHSPNGWLIKLVNLPSV
jgi:hypothetical protein